ncbi:hypothetical protein FQR65_LT10037 [Abscondita terminalis]|nr:hypothetical protein FQR65_LT10037 [Abscondita terminalis]
MLVEVKGELAILADMPPNESTSTGCLFCSIYRTNLSTCVPGGLKDMNLLILLNLGAPVTEKVVGHFAFVFGIEICSDSALKEFFNYGISHVKIKCPGGGEVVPHPELLNKSLWTSPKVYRRARKASEVNKLGKSIKTNYVRVAYKALCSTAMQNSIFQTKLDYPLLRYDSEDGLRLGTQLQAADGNRKLQPDAVGPMRNATTDSGCSRKEHTAIKCRTIRF